MSATWAYNLALGPISLSIINLTLFDSCQGQTKSAHYLVRISATIHRTTFSVDPALLGPLYYLLMFCVIVVLVDTAAPGQRPI